MPECRFLVLDDEPDIGALLVTAIRMLNYEARSVTTFEDFDRALAEWRPTHITLDLQMPGYDGVETIRALAERGSNARIVLVSGVDAKVLEMAALLGRERGLDIAGTLTKPWGMARLNEMLTRIVHENPLGADAIAKGIENDEFRLFMQPKVRLPGGRITGFEALVRWNHPRLGLQSPINFIPLAEQSGLIEPLTRWILGRAADVLAGWKSEGISAQVSVNLSARNLMSLTVADEFAEIVRARGLDCSCFILELTESAAITNLVDALDILVRLRLKQFALSIDDFGTGYSSLAQLQRLPFSELKIDRSFVSACAASAEATNTIRAIVELARRLELDLVAEGVETEAVERTLIGLGITHAQGFRYGRPEPAEVWSPRLRCQVA
ncbi:EAL domain-containing response regulator [Ancylobacter mangrovi]|uniref:EAL domain-containing response regulator n=1 Tax=Ancylobacter mangrovi TaxID=2972472 RepID=UPI0021634BD7|nr:EAL domain-containing response regulator [Ancylobacter mangrovi]MCS0502271.1 EAL domain-containing response regulator [Ancylobacter mangrovi]